MCIRDSYSAGERTALGASSDRSRKDVVADARDLNHLSDIMNANDVRSGKNARGDGGGRAPDAFIRLLAKSMAEKTFARSADQDRATKLAQLGKSRDERVILLESFSEANSRIHHDLRFRNARAPGNLCLLYTSRCV